ncbi:MAG: phosphoesterase [Chitinivibrionales bacterium]|nr:phosphoesterase [Chitinivibrionales bacterium]
MIDDNIKMNSEVDYKQKLKDFKAHILPASSVLIVAHDYPDPDCIASAYGLTKLFASWKIKNSIITFGGFIGRAENRALIRYLDIEMIPFPLIDLKEFDRIVMVDCFPGSGNVSLPENATVDAVLDHHMSEPEGDVSYYYDIRKDLGATSTLVAQYLDKAKVHFSREISTALFYGIKTDTSGLGRDAHPEDEECYVKLFCTVNHTKLAHIENPERDIEFFKTIHRGSEAAIEFNHVGYTHLGEVTAPDYIAEMADFFHSLERMEWMICSGIFKKSIFFSLRSKNVSGAGKKAVTIAKKLGGNAGGHGRLAAGRIPLNGVSAEEQLSRFIATFKKVFRIQNSDGVPILERE